MKFYFLIKNFAIKIIFRNFKNILLEIIGLKSLDNLVMRGLKLGQNVTIMSSVYLDPSHCWLISIGDNVTIAPNVKIFTHDTSSKHLIGFTKISSVKIGNNSFIGANVIILPGSIIGENCILGAGSVFKGVLEDNMCFYGNKVNTTTETVRLRDKLLKDLNHSRVFSKNYLYPTISEVEKIEMINYLEKHSCAFLP